MGIKLQSDRKAIKGSNILPRRREVRRVKLAKAAAYARNRLRREHIAAERSRICRVSGK